MKERVFSFGADEVLVGVMTEPDPGCERPGAPAVILTNIGMNHRVGPFRLNVELARALAKDGFVVLRFDLSGRGDSDVRRDSLSEAERASADMQDAMALLTKRKGTQSFVLVGLCSGVDSVHAASVQDPRVAGVVWLDGYGYRTTQYWLRWYTVRYLDTHQWKRVIRGQMSRLLGTVGGGVREVKEQPAVFKREYPKPESLRADIEAMVQRGARLLFIYTGGVRTEVNYRDQFFDMLGAPQLRGKVEVEFWPKSDHLFSSKAQREELIERMRAYMNGFADPRRVTENGDRLLFRQEK